MHPILLHLGHLILPTFGLLAAAGLIAALTLSERTARLVHLPPDALWNAGLFTVISAFLVSRLLLIATSLRSFLHYPFLLLTLPSLTPTGLLFTALATWIYLRRRHLPLLAVLDAWAPCATLLWAALALGHLAEGSDPGLPSHLPWAVRINPLPFPQHPVALYAALLALALTALLLHRLRSNIASPARPTAPTPAPGTTAALALLLTGVAQFLLSFLREPLLAVYTPTPLVEPLQWLSLALVLAGSLLLLTRPTLPISAPHLNPAPPVLPTDGSALPSPSSPSPVPRSPHAV